MEPYNVHVHDGPSTEVKVFFKLTIPEQFFLPEFFDSPGGRKNFSEYLRGRVEERLDDLLREYVGLEITARISEMRSLVESYLIYLDARDAEIVAASQEVTVESVEDSVNRFLNGVF